jgi:Ricin-type beta-trefoil lectin domain
MDNLILETLGKIAGIAGIGVAALGVFLQLFRDVIRKQIFPKLPPGDAYRLIRQFLYLTFSIAALGLAAWVVVEIIDGSRKEGPPAASPLPSPGETRMIVSNLETGYQSKLCLDVPNSQYAQGKKLIVWECHGSPNEEFTFSQHNEITIQELCLQPENDQVGAAVILSSCDGGTMQKWKLRQDGSIVGYQGRCLIVGRRNADQNLSVVMNSCNQTWSFSTPRVAAPAVLKLRPGNAPLGRA